MKNEKVATRSRLGVMLGYLGKPGTHAHTHTHTHTQTPKSTRVDTRNPAHAHACGSVLTNTLAFLEGPAPEA